MQKFILIGTWNLTIKIIAYVKDRHDMKKNSQGISQEFY